MTSDKEEHDAKGRKGWEKGENKNIKREKEKQKNKGKRIIRQMNTKRIMRKKRK